MMETTTHPVADLALARRLERTEATTNAAFVPSSSARKQCRPSARTTDPVGAGALSIGLDVALLAGASTIPDARRRGVQRALLEARLRFAAGCGIPLAMMVAQPGSGSQRNAERQGFRVAYTRLEWVLERQTTL